MDSYDPQQIAEDRDIIAEATAKGKIRPLFRAGESTAAGAAKSLGSDDSVEDALLRLGPPPIGDDPSAFGDGHDEGP